MIGSYIICDLDGTLCDADHRVALAKAGQWNEFHAASKNDQPNEDVQFILRELGNYELLIVTGRTDDYRQQTLDWLKYHMIFPTELLMRPVKDYRKDGELKVALLESFFGSKEKVLQQVILCLEDRDQMVEAYRNYGLRCWQVRSGSY